MNSKRICIGKIATAHGVRGLVKVHCFADDPQLLNGVLFTAQTGDGTISLTMKNSMGKYWLAEVAGISDRDAALALRETELWTDRDILPETESEDEFYIEDLVGLRAIDADGKDVGVIVSVQNFGAGDLLEIRPPGGETYFLPFTKECAPSVRLDEGVVEVVPL